MKRIVITVIVAVALLVGVDFAAASVAEYQVSTKMQEQLGLPSEPDVRINGFPFLTQALAGDYAKVDVWAEKVDVGQLHDVGVHALLYHVKVPVQAVLSGSVRGLRVDSAEGSVLITKEDLANLLPGTKKLKVDPVNDGTLDEARQGAGNAAPGSTLAGLDPDKAVKLTGSITVAGQPVNATVIAALEMSGNQVQISPRDIRVGNGAAVQELPRPVQVALRQAFTLRIDPGRLPFGVTPTRLRAVDNALEVTGSATNVIVGDPTDSAPSSDR
jgi:hypothetical protein